MPTPHSLTPHVSVGHLSRARPTGARTQGRLGGRISGPPGVQLEGDRRQARISTRASHSWGPTWSGGLGEDLRPGHCYVARVQPRAWPAGSAQ